MEWKRAIRSAQDPKAKKFSTKCFSILSIYQKSLGLQVDNTINFLSNVFGNDLNAADLNTADLNAADLNAADLNAADLNAALH